MSLRNRKKNWDEDKINLETVERIATFIFFDAIRIWYF